MIRLSILPGPFVLLSGPSLSLNVILRPAYRGPRRSTSLMEVLSSYQPRLSLPPFWTARSRRNYGQELLFWIYVFFSSDARRVARLACIFRHLKPLFCFPMATTAVV